MILTVDIGNTKVSFGFFENEKLTRKEFVLTESLTKTSELTEIFSNDFPIGISSVVPNATNFLIEFLAKNFKKKPFVITSKSKLPIKLDYKTPQTLGVDRICSSVAAFNKFGKNQNIVVADIGTALTLDVVTKEGKFIGGVIAPGPKTLLWSLTQKGAQLPEVPFEFSASPVGKNTIECIQSGVFWSTVFQIDSFSKFLENDFGEKPLVVATGGFGELISQKSNSIDKIEPELVLEGVRDLIKLNS
ncbi:MAG: type III pantothenate kinase [Calditrichaeota bacterium]|nr:MAG: type III pantothenate kinase [Calditrichota bacterium]